MKFLVTVLGLMLITASVAVAQTLTIGLSSAATEVDTSSTGNEALVKLDWDDGTNGAYTYGVWAWTFDVTSTNATIGGSIGVSLHSSISSSFNISTSAITNGLRVSIQGKNKKKFLLDNYSAAATYFVATITYNAPSSTGTFSLTFNNVGTAVKRVASGSNAPSSQTITDGTLAQIITVSAPIPPNQTPILDNGLSKGARKYGDINWDDVIDISDVTAASFVTIAAFDSVDVDTGSGDYRKFYAGDATHDASDSTVTDVEGVAGGIDLLDVATIQDAILDGVWPSYARASLVGKPASKLGGGEEDVPLVPLALVSGAAGSAGGASSANVTFEVFGSGQANSKIRVSVENVLTMHGLQIDFTSSLLRGELEAWKSGAFPTAVFDYQRNNFDRIVFLLHEQGNVLFSPGTWSHVLTISIPYVTPERVSTALQRVTAGIYSRSEELSYAVLEGAASAIPLQFGLQQNYPNPFNPSTVIQYEVPDVPGGMANINIIVYNLLGEKIKTLFSGEHDAGRYNVRWDATDDGGSRVTSGVYFVRLTSDNIAMTKKMVLIR